MEYKEIKEYRKILEEEFTNKDNEIESQLSYITIGSLGFFMTINEKFIRIQDSHCKILLIVSVISLFIAFVFILIRKSRTSHHDLSMMNFIDGMSPNFVEDDKKLLTLWNNSHDELKKLRIVIYVALSLGIGLQVVFLILNYFV